MSQEEINRRLTREMGKHTQEFIQADSDSSEWSRGFWKGWIEAMHIRFVKKETDD